MNKRQKKKFNKKQNHHNWEYVSMLSKIHKALSKAVRLNRFHVHGNDFRDETLLNNFMKSVNDVLSDTPYMVTDDPVRVSDNGKIVNYKVCERPRYVIDIYLGDSVSTENNQEG